MPIGQKVLYKNCAIITVTDGEKWRFRIIDLDHEVGSEPLRAPGIEADSEMEIIDKAKKWIDTLK